MKFILKLVNSKRHDVVGFSQYIDRKTQTNLGCMKAIFARRKECLRDEVFKVVSDSLVKPLK